MTNIFCFGDSNTYGYDPRSYLGGRYPGGTFWTDILNENPYWHVTNGGMNGRTIPDGRTAALPGADLLVVMLGSNDLLCGYSPEDTAARMERFLAHAAPQYPQTLLVAPPPMKRGEWVTEERLPADSARLAEEYRAVAERLHIHFADAGQWGVELAFDGVHFSQAGHLAFAKGISFLLNSIIE